MSAACTGSLKIISRELAECKLHSMEVQEVGWDKGGPGDNYIFFYRNGNADHLGAGSFIRECQQLQGQNFLMKICRV
jgi:hypothetical protein